MPHLKLSPLIAGTAWAFMWVCIMVGLLVLAGRL